MSEDLIIKHCAPTLAGLKTGNIFNASYESEDELDRSLAGWNRILERRGLKAICLRATAGRALIYVYRPQLLEQDLTGTEASEVLRGFGYVPNDPDSCIEHLADRIAQFSKCTGVYLKHMKCGAGLEKLAVRKH